MNPDDAARTADSAPRAPRARWPRWRADRPAPAWFRGEELDRVDPAERRQLYEAATRRIGPVPWPQVLSMAALLGLLIARGHATWHASYAAALAAWIAGVVVSARLRRRHIREQACDMLRESADRPPPHAQPPG